jgi:NAD(P)H dehydrogenase (quinone)
MNILIVHAHPEPRSFTTAMKDCAVRTFEKQGHKVVVSDLYDMNFNPVSGREDFKHLDDEAYLVYALEQRNGVKGGTIADDIAEEIEKVKQADLVIFSFPLYWFSMPAIMKGWIDKVMVSGLCYGGKRFYDRGGLKGKKALLAFSLGGREHMFGEDAIHGPIEEMLRPILRGTLAYVGFEVLKPFVAWHVPYISDEARKDYLSEYQNYLEDLDQAEVLRFPSMDDFDDRLYPLKPQA